MKVLWKIYRAALAMLVLLTLMYGSMRLPRAQHVILGILLAICVYCAGRYDGMEDN